MTQRDIIGKTKITNGFPECEWNPKENRNEYDSEYHADAWIIAGSRNKIFLCKECAKLEIFKRKKQIVIAGRK